MYTTWYGNTNIIGLYEGYYLPDYNSGLFHLQNYTVSQKWTTHCRWNSTGCRRRLCLRLLWPVDLISMSHTWLNFGENIYEDIVFTQFSGYYLQWPWSLSPKANQHIDEPKYICYENWVKFLSLVRYGVHKVFWSLSAVTLMFKLLI